MTRPDNRSDEVAEATRQDIFKPLPAPLVQRVLGAAPFISISGVHNVRDVALAGSDIQHTPSLKPGILFRAAALNGITQQGAAELAQIGVIKIFDLRSERERKHSPTPDIPGVENIWIPASKEPSKMDLTAFGVEEQLQPAFAAMYDDILIAHTPVYRHVFEHIRDAAQGQSLLFHCQAGKDRTGVLAALILSLAGVPAEVISHDYTLTRIGLEPARDSLLRIVSTQPSERFAPGSVNKASSNPGKPSSESKAAEKPQSGDLAAAVKQAVQNGDAENSTRPLLAGLCRSDYASMQGFLQRLDQTYGGAEGYLSSQLGFSPADIITIRSKLLA